MFYSSAIVQNCKITVTLDANFEVAQANLSLHWVHRHIVVCHVTAQILCEEVFLTQILLQENSMEGR